jgi:hypothetical protein
MRRTTAPASLGRQGAGAYQSRLRLGLHDRAYQTQSVLTVACNQH